MKTFSVLTVSKRMGWEYEAQHSINRQTVKPDKWVIVPETSLSMYRYEEWIEIVGAPKKKRASNLNASLNEGLRHITSDYVIFYQDFIDLRPDCFEKLLNLATPNTFVTTCTPNYGGSDDGRYLGVDRPRPCQPQEWEANVAIAPMEVIRKLGGFDERLDDGWSWDNVLLAEKAYMLGCKFIIDESNRPKLLPHELTSKKKLELNGQRCVDILNRIRSGKEPLDCGCLGVGNGNRG